MSTNHRRRNRRRRGDRLRALAIILASLGVWAGAFAVIVSGTGNPSSGAPIASIPTDTPLPASAYAKMLQDIASRAPDASSLWGGGDNSGNSSGNSSANDSGKKADAKAKSHDRTHKSAAGNRPSVAVAAAPNQVSTQGLVTATDSTVPPTTGAAPTTGGLTSTTTTTTTTTTVGNPPPTGPIISVSDPRLTPAQSAAAQALIDGTTYAMGRYPTEKLVLAAGYVWIGDTDKNGYQTYVNYSYLADGRELDATHVEAIILQRDATGAAKVVAAVYILEPNKTMANVPDIAGALTTWHARADLCRAANGTLSPQLAAGTCATGSVPVVMPPSLDVWLVPNTCGPFATTTADPKTCQG